MTNLLAQNIPARTVSETFAQTVAKFGDMFAIRHTVPKLEASPAAKLFTDTFEQVYYTWQDYNNSARAFAKALIHYKVKPQNAVTIQGSNSPRWLFANMGTILAGGISAGVYPTNNAETSKHVAASSEAKIVVVEDESQLKKYAKMQKTAVKCFVVMNKIVDKKSKEDLPAPVITWDKFIKKGKDVKDEKLDKRIRKQTADKVCALIYTSGTTGMPKAAALTHDNLTWTAAKAGDTFSLDETHQGLSYLPLSHIASQQLDCIAPITYGYAVDIAPSSALKGNNLIQHIAHAGPTYFLAVPRVWEKFKEGMDAKLNAAPWHRRMLFMVATHLSLKAVNALQRIEAKEPTAVGMFDKLVKKISTFVLNVFEKSLFSPIKKALGLSNCKHAASGAGALDPKVADFFKSMNIRIIDVYGMSESSGPATIASSPNAPRGSSGTPLVGTEVIIADPNAEGEGEIRLKGRHIFKEYWNNHQATKETFDENGYLRTGDLGKLDADGNLFITGRIKELIKTSGGENIPPVRIEQKIQEMLPEISNAVVIGDKKNYLTCLLTLKTKLGAGDVPTNVLTPEVQAKFVQLGSSAKTVEEAITCELVQKYIKAGIEKANKQADSQAQNVQKFTVLAEDFTVANGMMTSTLKLRRQEITKKYAEQIDSMYRGA
ncbi:MAG: AMP-binding protein [Chlamydiales bacterium]|nr:AMP-binding protein [Chlamydiales bacterium]